MITALEAPLLTLSVSRVLRVVPTALAHPISTVRVDKLVLGDSIRHITAQPNVSMYQLVDNVWIEEASARRSSNIGNEEGSEATKEQDF